MIFIIATKSITEVGDRVWAAAVKNITMCFGEI